MIVAFVLIGLIILAMPLYQRYVLRRVEERPFRVSEVERETDEGVEEEGGRIEKEERHDAGISPVIVGEKREAAASGERFVPQEVVVENELFRGVISTEGGTIRRWQLKRFRSADRVGDVELVGEGVIGGGIWITDGIGRYDLTRAEFSPDVERLDLVGDEIGEVRFVWRVGSRRVEKAFHFKGDRYDFKMVVRLAGFEGNVDCAVGWEGGILPTEANVREDVGYTKVYTYMGGEMESYDEKKGKPLSVEVEGRLEWACVRNKYFVVALIPSDGEISKLRAEGEVEEDLGHKRFDMWVEQDVGDDGVFESRVYVGPLKYEVVSKLGVELERTMLGGWKWIQPIMLPIRKLVVRILLGLRRVIPNYGVVIIVFSILVKVVLYPLTRKSRQATLKMQRLQPELAKLREKYQGDREGLNRATMRLYKEHGANPVGGCFPMLLQMPILIALFTVFRNTIEFRQAEFISWWISDLSLPDRTLILPVLMGVTMFIQQKMTMKDPKQAAMVYVMPAVMIFLFRTFPAGLVLYYTMFNILSLVEQVVMVKRSGREIA